MLNVIFSLFPKRNNLVKESAMKEVRLIKRTRKGANLATNMTVTLLLGKPEGQSKPPAAPATPA
jgi:hypothetical protein